MKKFDNGDLTARVVIAAAIKYKASGTPLARLAGVTVTAKTAGSTRPPQGNVFLVPVTTDEGVTHQVGHKALETFVQEPGDAEPRVLKALFLERLKDMHGELTDRPRSRRSTRRTARDLPAGAMAVSAKLSTDGR